MVRRSRRRRVGALVATAAALLATSAAPAPDGARASEPRSASVDRDGDGVTDDLEAQLATARPSDRFDVIATFHDRAAQAAAERGLAVGELRRSFTIVHGFSASMTAARIGALSRAVGLRRIELNGTMHTLMDASRRDFGVELVRRNFAADGAGVGVCIADTGVDPQHEQFDSKLPIPFYDAINGRTTVYDDHGHGTHVASIAVGDGTGGSLADDFGGVAPAAGLVVAKILDSNGSGTDAQVIAGIEWCAGRSDVHVINLSIGDPYVTSDGQGAVSQAVDNAVATYGKVVAAAAGNSGDIEGSVTAPGDAALAVTVGAAAEWSAPAGSNRDSRGVYLAPFSSRGPTADGRIKPDVAAPGHSVVAAASGTTATYTGKSGTSMATPFVAGVAALALGVRPDLSPARVKLLLESTARDRGIDGKDIDWGAGLVDAYEIVRMLADIRRYDHHVFPWEEYVEASVADNSTWSTNVEVDEAAIGAPLAVTMIIDLTATCIGWWGSVCLGWEYSPDLDLELYDPSGNQVAYSICPAGASHVSCGPAGVGRQETIGYRPTVAGTYRLDVVTVVDSGSDGTGGSFSLSIQRRAAAPAPPRLPLVTEPTSSGGTVSVASLAGRAESAGRTWTAHVDVAVSGTTDGIVFGHFAHDGQVRWCALDAGRCTVTRPALSSDLQEVVFTVTDIAVGSLADDNGEGDRTVLVRRTVRDGR